MFVQVLVESCGVEGWRTGGGGGGGLPVSLSIYESPSVRLLARLLAFLSTICLSVRQPAHLSLSLSAPPLSIPIPSHPGEELGGEGGGESKTRGTLHTAPVKTWRNQERAVGQVAPSRRW